MALAVARTIERGGALVVEAGTGVGKTFSYLVPALLQRRARAAVAPPPRRCRTSCSAATCRAWSRRWGCRCARRCSRAAPATCACTGWSWRGSDATLPDRGRALRTLAKIEQWAQVTRTGDLAELPGLDERSPLIPLVTSTRENCLGAQCPKFRACHVNLARREALAADVVVINHHLFFADLAVRESGMAELLPTRARW